MHEDRNRPPKRRSSGPRYDQFLLMRPRQWPILSVQLAVGVLCAPAVLQVIAGDGRLSWTRLVAAWFAWVVCLNGGTLAYNSAYDRDTEDIAYLASPPTPPPGTARDALLLMIVGALAGLFVGLLFAGVIAVCVALSVLYSHPAVRLKGVPGADLAVNVVGYGAGTTLAGLAAGACAAGVAPSPDQGTWLLVGGFGLLFGSFYPMTQIYQIESDLERGDRSLASALGARNSLAFAALLGTGATACMYGAFSAWGLPTIAPLIGGAGWTVFCLVWFRASDGMPPEAHGRWMYAGLAAWAAVDLALLAGALARPFGLIV